MTPLLLDTHAWIWLAAGDRRLAPRERELNRAAQEKQLLVSAVSVYETSIVGIETDAGRRRGRQAVKMRPTVQGWIRDAIVGTSVIVVPVDAEIALDGALLHAMHADPFDRLIVATAVRTGARLFTADAKIIAFAEKAGVGVAEL